MFIKFQGTLIRSENIEKVYTVENVSGFRNPIRLYYIYAKMKNGDTEILKEDVKVENIKKEVAKIEKILNGSSESA